MNNFIRENWFKLSILLIIILLLFKYSKLVGSFLDKESIFNLLGIVLIIAGWLIVSWQQRKDLKNSAQMKIYEDFYQIKKDIDESVVNLGLKLSKFHLPFLEMSFREDKLTPIDKNVKDIQLWTKHVDEISQEIYKFTERYIDLWDYSEVWIGAIPNLKKAKKELFEVQLKDLVNKMYEHHSYLRNQSIQQFDWKLWNRKEIEGKAEETSDLFNKVACGYIEDYFVLIHNKLVSPILGYRKIHRENFNKIDKVDSYFILTENGLKKITNKK